jgi:hypothetical protein
MCDKGTDTINKIKEFDGVLCNDCLVIVFNNLSGMPHEKRNKKPRAL